MSFSSLFPEKYIVICGNYGSGKTELSLNLARALARNERVTLVDLDIVNPYFRSAEKADELEAMGIRVLMPTFALTTVDIPALPAEIQSVFESPDDRVIFDVGGDDTGAAALGRYYPSFMAHRRETVVALVLNAMRPLTGSAEDVLDLAQRIQNRGRLAVDALVNNTNLADLTTPEMLRQGEALTLNCAEKLGLTRVMTVARQELLNQTALATPALPVIRYMKPEWMEL